MKDDNNNYVCFLLFFSLSLPDNLVRRLVSRERKEKEIYKIRTWDGKTDVKIVV